MSSKYQTAIQNKNKDYSPNSHLSGLVKCTLSSSLKINFGEQSTRLLIDMLAILKFIIFNKVAMVMSFPLNYIVCIIG